jgi:hypothetical protein
METLSARPSGIENSTSTESLAKAEGKFLGTSWATWQFNYYSVITVTLTVGSIIGAIAAALILNNDSATWQLAACAMLSMFNNTTAIGNLPVKWVLYSHVISVMGNVALILINLF